MVTFAERLQSAEFLVGVEIVAPRAPLSAARAAATRERAAQLATAPRVDWVSVTDNAGGHPQVAPPVVGRPIRDAGKPVVIHLTCKDRNRNGLEAAAWALASEGFHNVLAMTGDYPAGGAAKPVFDLDSVGLIVLLDRMNRGLDGRHDPTRFCIGAVTSNHKLLEGEVVPQYLKLRKKVSCGAQFIINQVGYDARKDRELRRYMREHGMDAVPLIGSVFLLTARAARQFHAGRVPGIVVTTELLAACETAGRSADGGARFFLELAAKQIAVFRGLGFRGVYLGGVHDGATVERLLDLERTFAPDDWQAFARETRYSRPGEFFFYGDGDARPAAGARRPRHGSAAYRFSAWAHRAAFTSDRRLARWGARVAARAADPRQGPALLRVLERASKSALFRCRDCGDCSLPDIAFLCPESQCAKNQRNGPCGGTRDGQCEVPGFGDCIWLRAYERRRLDGTEASLLEHVPVIQDASLRGTSSWANRWLGRDHAARPAGRHDTPPASGRSG